MDNEPIPPDAAPAEPAPPAEQLAGFWVRGGAYFVDMLVLSLSVFLPLQGLSVVVGLAYKTIFLSQGGQTPGKMAAGIKVVQVSGEPVGVGRALGRSVAEYLSAALVFLGYAAAAAPGKRALHDYLAGTKVVYVEGVGNGRKAAFATLGALCVLLVAGVFGAMVFASAGKFSSLIAKSGEGATKGNLGVLRSALAIYYGDNEGQYPATLDALIGPKYVPAMPKTKTGKHPESDAWTPYGAELCTGSTEYGKTIDPSKIKDTGGWGYVADPKAKCYGEVFVDCSHEDTKGRVWPQY